MRKAYVVMAICLLAVFAVAVYLNQVGFNPTQARGNLDDNAFRKAIAPCKEIDRMAEAAMPQAEVAGYRQGFVFQPQRGNYRKASADLKVMVEINNRLTERISLLGDAVACLARVEEKHPGRVGVAELRTRAADKLLPTVRAQHNLIHSAAQYATAMEYPCKEFEEPHRYNEESIGKLLELIPDNPEARVLAAQSGSDKYRLCR